MCWALKTMSMLSSVSGLQSDRSLLEISTFEMLPFHPLLIGINVLRKGKCYLDKMSNYAHH